MRGHTDSALRARSGFLIRYYIFSFLTELFYLKNRGSKCDEIMQSNSCICPIVISNNEWCST